MKDEALEKKLRNYLSPEPKNIEFCGKNKIFDARKFDKNDVEFCVPADGETRSREHFFVEILPEKIRVKAFPEAQDWALDLIQQLIEWFPKKQIPAMKIEDWPDLPTRGFMLDISRGRVPLESELYKLVEILHRLRYNQLQLYVEHTFAFKNHEIVWRDASPIDAEFVQKFDAFCRSRGIELVPNLNSFGHVERWLKHAPYRHLAECPDGFYHELAKEHRPAGTFEPTEESADFMGELYAEYLPNFSSKFFNIGGDEPWELGLGKSAKKCRSRGKREVYVEHMMRLKNRAETQGKKIMFWADVLLEENAAPLPQEFLAGTVPVIWGYEKGHPFEEQILRVQAALPEGQKNDFMVAPGTSTWLAILPRGQNARRNIWQACHMAKKYGGRGMLLTNWGDKGYFNMPGLTWPAILAGAGTSWTVGERPYPGTKSRVQLARLFADGGDAKAADLLARYVYDAFLLEETISLKMPNRSVLHAIFFAENSKKAREIGAELNAIELEEIDDALRKAKKPLQKLVAGFEARAAKSETVKNSEFGLTLRELVLAFRLERAAIERARGNANAVFGASYEAYRAKFAELWRLRSREGGLAESLEFWPPKED